MGLIKIKAKQKLYYGGRIVEIGGQCVIDEGKFNSRLHEKIADVSEREYQKEQDAIADKKQAEKEAKEMGIHFEPHTTTEQMKAKIKKGKRAIGRND
jgi:hypothetical protein